MLVCLHHCDRNEVTPMTTMTTHRPAEAVEPALNPVPKAPRTAGVPAFDDADLRARMHEILNRRIAVGMAVGIVSDGRLAAFHGHGFADLETRRPITEDTLFRIASITKTFTAIAVMQLVERGLVDLDRPANDYLKAYRLAPTSPGFPAVTVRHLLTHTAGIGEVARPSDLLRPDWGDSVVPGARVPSLAEFYRGALAVDIEPGTTFTYTNHGYATLGQIVEDVGGQPLASYLRTNVFEPLGMVDTDLRPDAVPTDRRASGYAPSPVGPRRVVGREWVTVGASSIWSTTRDMARYAAALMGGGANDHGRILERDTLTTMFAPHFQPEPRVPGMGLGFDRNPAGGHLVVGHGGILPGFNSQLFVAPEDRVAVMAFVTGGHLAMLWLPSEMGRLINELLGVPVEAVRTDLPQHPEVWGELCGRYTFTGRLTDIRARLMTGMGARVFVRGDSLILRLLTPVPALLAGLPLRPDDPDDPYAFRVDLSRFGLPTARVVFSLDGMSATALHLDIFPMSLRRAPLPAVASTRSRVAIAVATSVAMSSAASLIARRGTRRAARRRRAA
jgi:CubicO group peptidase (beta-lactamase class C family)